MVERRFDPGKCLMKVDEQGTEFFIIVSGKCEVITKEGDKVAELIERRFDPGK